MFKSALMAIAAAGALAAVGGAAHAQPTIQTDPNFIAVSGGCGPYAWRGPHGHCRFDGPGRWGFPGPYYRWNGPYYRGNGCPPGYWRGPWGNCRNTPYHGRLPNGGWK